MARYYAHSLEFFGLCFAQIIGRITHRIACQDVNCRRFIVLRILSLFPCCLLYSLVNKLHII